MDLIEEILINRNSMHEIWSTPHILLPSDQRGIDPIRIVLLDEYQETGVWIEFSVETDEGEVFLRRRFYTRENTKLPVPTNADFPSFHNIRVRLAPPVPDDSEQASA